MRFLHFDIDSLRPDHLGCYGYPRPTSPNIDAVAADGVRFDRCYVSDSPCMPSRAAFITGRFGIQNGIVTHGPRFNRPNLPQHVYGGPLDDYKLLPIQLRKNGIHSVCFSTFPVRHMATWFGLGWGEMHTPSLEWGGEYAEEVSAKVIDWLRKNEGRDDYFLHVNLWDPHRIYKDSLHTWADRFDGVSLAEDFPSEADLERHQSYTGPFTANAQGGADLERQTRLMPGHVRTRDDVRKMIDGYDAMIAYTDHHVGLILDELKRQGVYDEAAVSITADHGDAFGEHGVYSDHVCAHEPVHRVPLIVRWPGVAAAGTASDELVYQLDWTSTLCDLTGGGAPAGHDGVSLAEHLRGGAGPGRDALFLTHGLYTLQRGVRTRRHLLLRTYDHHDYNQFDHVELYDVEADPHLTRNLRAAEPELVDELQRRLDSWLAVQAERRYFSGDRLLEVRDHRASLRKSA